MNIKKNIFVTGAIMLSVLVLAGFFFVNVNVALAADCGNSGIRSEVYVRGTYAFVSVSNDNSNCSVPINLKSYKMYDRVLSNQTLYDDASMVVGPNSTRTLNVDIPQCVSQIDAYIGNGPVVPAPGYNIIAWTFASNGVDVGHSFPTGNYCTKSTPPPPPPPVIPTLNGSCSVNPSSVTVGGTLNWSATASGGNGSYAYSWTGTDSLMGNSNSVSKVYPNAGTKTGTVTITSGSQSITKTCSAVVNTLPVNNDLTVSCSASPSSVDVDEDVTWRAYPSGGNGSYNYDWSGTDGLDGSSRNITWSYDDNGTKHANVTVTSGSQSASASCTVRVVEEEVFDDLNVRCYASPGNPQIGSRMNWYARVTGGDGHYDYDWSGTDGLNSSSRSPYKTYDTPGTKRATVTVTDGDGNEDTATCYANINSVLAFSQVNQQPMLDAVYLSQVPYTGFADNMKLYFFIGMLALFSAWMAYIIIERKKQTEELN